MTTKRQIILVGDPPLPINFIYISLFCASLINVYKKKQSSTVNTQHSTHKCFTFIFYTKLNATMISSSVAQKRSNHKAVVVIWLVVYHLCAQMCSHPSYLMICQTVNHNRFLVYDVNKAKVFIIHNRLQLIETFE